jgi:hypothetical protein
MSETGYYAVRRINSIADVHAIFDRDNLDYTLNWLFIGTSGVHGSYASLTDWGADPIDEETGEATKLTILIVKPRTCQLLYGEVPIEAQHIPWLRQVVNRTIEGIVESQQGSSTINLPVRPRDEAYSEMSDEALSDAFEMAVVEFDGDTCNRLAEEQERRHQLPQRPTLAVGE